MFCSWHWLLCIFFHNLRQQSFSCIFSLGPQLILWACSLVGFFPQKFKFLESQPLVQTLQDWSRTSWNLLESKDTKLKFTLRLTVEGCTEVYINGLFLHSQRTNWKYNFWQFLNSDVLTTFSKGLASPAVQRSTKLDNGCTDMVFDFIWGFLCTLIPKTLKGSNGFQHRCKLIYQTSYSFKDKAPPKEKTLSNDWLCIYLDNRRTLGKNNTQKL